MYITLVASVLTIDQSYVKTFWSKTRLAYPLNLNSLFGRVRLYRQVNNKPHVQIKPTKDHAKSYAAYRGMTLKKPMTEVAI